MKSKLTIFFAGFGAGLAAAILLIGLAADRPRAERHVSQPTVIYHDTNAAAMWQNARIQWKAEGSIR